MFNQLEGIQLGPIFLSYFMINLILGIIFAYNVFAYLVKKSDREEAEKILATVQTSMIIFIIIFKISPLLMNPTYIFSPRKLLLYTGGPFAIYISTFISLFYFGFHLIKQKWSLNIINQLAIAFYVYLIVKALVIKSYGVSSPFSFGWLLDDVFYHPLNLYYALFYSITLVSVVLLFQKDKKNVIAVSLFVAYFLIETVLIPFIP